MVVNLRGDLPRGRFVNGTARALAVSITCPGRRPARSAVHKELVEAPRDAVFRPRPRAGLKVCRGRAAPATRARGGSASHFG